ncbi:LOB domain-containing protein 1-like [Canna indica]|uniref:LOB domain-containing protein 1-like n=1 Tax=Canna indica TaxID=4628 RepID=A0AAQ3K069_9LILI|nr:LOB domain-containing protein 1-like [Canna indica]
MARTKLDLPCAACRLLHRKCNRQCLLAPYFPAEEPDKFARVHKVFGASNVIKMLQAVKEGMNKEDAIKSMVYEAHARLQDPIYGCAGIILYLQKCVEDLQAQLRTVQQQVLDSQLQRHQLLSVLTMDANQEVNNPVLPVVPYTK